MNFNNEDFHKNFMEPFNYNFDVKNICEQLVGRPDLCSQTEIIAMIDFLINFDSSQNQFAEFLGRVYKENPESIYKKFKEMTLPEVVNFDIDKESAKLYSDACSSLLSQIDKLLLAISVTEEELLGLKTSKAEDIVKIIEGYFDRTKNANFTHILMPAAEAIRRVSFAIYKMKDLLNIEKTMGMKIDRFVDVFWNFIISSNEILSNYETIMSYATGFDITSKEEVQKQLSAGKISVGAYYNDYYNALSAINKLIDFLGSIMGWTHDEMLKIINSEEKDKLLAKGSVVQFKQTDEETTWTPDFMYDKVFDSWTYIRYLYETLNKTGIPTMQLLEVYFGLNLVEKVFYYDKIIEQFPTDEKYKDATVLLKNMATHTYWAEQALDILDIVYGFESGTLFKAVGSYSKKIVPNIKNVRFNIVN